MSDLSWRKVNLAKPCRDARADLQREHEFTLTLTRKECRRTTLAAACHRHRGRATLFSEVAEDAVDRSFIETTMLLLAAAPTVSRPHLAEAFDTSRHHQSNVQEEITKVGFCAVQASFLSNDVTERYPPVERLVEIA